MTILARYQNIEVEVVNVLHTGDGRTRAAIRATSGQPFTAHSFNGGPMATDSAVVSPDLLTDVHQVQPANPYGATRKSRTPGAQRPELVYEPLDETMAAVFPVKSRRQPWKGINSD